MTNINGRSLLRIVSLIMIIIAAAFVLCIPVALIYAETVMPFVWSALGALIPGLLVFFLIPGSESEKVGGKEGYLSVTLAWIILTIMGTLPYLLSGTIPGFTNAFFESVSGFTTTGATIFPDVEILPRSILFWRSLTEWIGGVGVILLVIIILPNLKVGAFSLFTLESSMKQKILPKTKSLAYYILLIYAGFTVAEIILLKLGGMNMYDSISHSLGSVSTGGFSTKNTSITDYSAYIQYVVAGFMFLSGIGYIAFFLLLKREFTRLRQYEEIWFYVFFTTAAVAIVTLILYTGTDRSFALSLRHGAFQAIAHITGTGFATSNYMEWPAIGWITMLLLMFAGGCTGSTTGGIKMARHLVALKNLQLVFIMFQHNNAIVPVKLNGRTVPENLNLNMLLFIILYLAITLTGILIILLTGIPLSEAAGAAVSSMTNVGSGLSEAGNYGHYANLPGLARITMVVLMIVGRLEIYTVLLLFTRSFWRN
jgi:trk system potassium uptake protein